MNHRTYALGLSLAVLAGCGEGAPPGDASSAREAAAAADPGAAEGKREGAPAGASREQRCLTNGECSARRVVENLDGVENCSWSDGAVWAISNDGVTRHDASGTTTFASTHSPGLTMVVGAGMVFWDCNARLYAMTSSNGRTSSVFLAQRNVGRPSDLTISNGRLYLRSGDTIYASDPLTFNDSNIDFQDIDSPGSNLQAMTVDGEQIYWAESDYDIPLSIKTRRDGQPVTLAEIEGGGWVFGLVVTPTHLVFADYDHRSVAAVPKGGGEPLTVAEDQVDTYQIAVDQSGIYWTSRAGIMRANIDGTGARRLLDVTFDGEVGRIAVSPTAIYWTDENQRAVYEMLK